MDFMPTFRNGWWRLSLTTLKVCSAIAPLFLFVLVGLLRLDSWLSVHLISLGCFLVGLILLFSASAHKNSTGRNSSFIFAAVAFLWIFILEILIPSLAKQKFWDARHNFGLLGSIYEQTKNYKHTKNKKMGGHFLRRLGVAWLWAFQILGRSLWSSFTRPDISIRVRIMVGS